MPRYALSWKQLHRLDRRRAVRKAALHALFVGGLFTASFLIGTLTV